MEREMEGVTELQAGRELDALVAEKVMGWKLAGGNAAMRAVGAPPYYLIDGMPRGLPHLSADIAAAWGVVEKLRAAGLCIDVSADVDGRFYLRVWRDNSLKAEIKNVDTAPLAICLAALEVVAGDG